MSRLRLILVLVCTLMISACEPVSRVSNFFAMPETMMVAHCHTLSSSPSQALCSCVAKRILAEEDPKLIAWLTARMIQDAVPQGTLSWRPSPAVTSAWLNEINLTPSQAGARLMQAAQRANLHCGGARQDSP